MIENEHISNISVRCININYDIIRHSYEHNKIYYFTCACKLEKALNYPVPYRVIGIIILFQSGFFLSFFLRVKDVQVIRR